MNLADYLAASAVSVRNDITSKKRALEEISRTLGLSARFVAENEIFTSLVNREKLGSTGLGAGVAIPHGRLKGLDHAIAAFIKLETPINYDANDGEPVDLVFGLLVPQSATSEHLNILAKVAEMFRDEAHVAKIREASDPAELHRLLTTHGVD